MSVSSWSAEANMLLDRLPLCFKRKTNDTIGYNLSNGEVVINSDHIQEDGHFYNGV